MINLFFIILLCVHVLGDFYFQTQKMSDKKRKQFLWTVYHSLIYAVVSWILFFLFLPGLRIRYILAFVGAHAAIDIIKYGVCRFSPNRSWISKRMNDRRNIFLIDQTAHIYFPRIVRGNRRFAIKNLSMRKVWTETQAG